MLLVLGKVFCENFPGEANCADNRNKAPQSVKKRIEVSEADEETGIMLKQPAFISYNLFSQRSHVTSAWRLVQHEQ